MTPLLSADELLTRWAQAPLILDCSHDLAEPEAGRRQHAMGRLPGARHLHLDDDLSGPKSPDGPRQGGRHPLPTLETLACRAGQWGVTPGRWVVLYDQQGAAYAARCWWLLRWLGHTQVQVLDGGLAAWLRAGGDLESGSLPPVPAGAPPYPLPQTGTLPTLQAETLLASSGTDWQVVDARAPERFRGEVEPLDSRAGHIPGALNYFFKDNLGADGCFLPAEALRRRFEPLGDPARLVHQCGSGVTACHNLLAMAQAGLPGSALYPGSWSEWSADPNRPVATGEAPGSLR
ncbi:sulfurtransferase [Ideonella livida]|uniref:Sulfurtransferase n=1 Tax=Ideonella livida TaxID=2707176 RepID=A0A7C9THH7_9BURK|nr:sulfurtransferase [Ideonella livida]NDY89684.1 sulfurtransferase [Ideonella livida]